MRALLAIFLLTATAAAQPLASETEAHFRLGTEYYKNGKWAEAVVELEAAQRLQPRAEFLYALGQAERQRKNCAKAIEHFEGVLALSKEPMQRVTAQSKIEQCRRELEGAPAVANPPTVTETKQLPLDPAPPSLFAAGLAITVIGMGLSLSTLGEYDQIMQSPCGMMGTCPEGNVRGIESRDRAGIAVASVGAVVAGAGLIWWIAKPRRAR